MDREGWILVRWRRAAASGREPKPCAREEELEDAEDIALSGGPGVLPPRHPLLQQRPGVASFEQKRRFALRRTPLDAFDPVGGAVGDLRAARGQVAGAHAQLRTGFDLWWEGGIAAAVVAQHDAATAAERPFVRYGFQHIRRDV